MLFHPTLTIKPQRFNFFKSYLSYIFSFRETEWMNQCFGSKERGLRSTSSWKISTWDLIKLFTERLGSMKDWDLSNLGKMFDY